MDTQIERIYTKNGRVAQQIAVQLLRLKKGGKLPRIDDFVRAFNVARGTIQGGLRLLEEMSAVRLESRGHLGTFLVDKDQSLLWKIADRGALVAAMPLPYSRRYEGLATGLVQIFEEMKLPFTIAYMRGADSRIEALRSRRIDFAIVSRWAAEKACRQYDDLFLQQSLGKKTYVEHHGVLFADWNKKQIEPGMRVGIDPSSPDQRDLTYAECEGLDVKLVEINYMQLFEQLESGQIDAAIWNLDETAGGSHWGKGRFQKEYVQNMSLSLSEAALLIRRPGEEVAQVLDALPVQKINQIQKEVLQGHRIPHY
ncbi:GntR family transcriptional regulator YhfZ [Kroppenstedtia eburnea]|uniref:GntR family transcriptional regulator YhfZ n=1 Tax=Kroppenstedtia eburnea TaxID=714067 RepID=UPI003632F3EE